MIKGLKQSESENILSEIAKSIDKCLKETSGRKIGFALMVFEFEHPGVGSYISNAERTTMISALKETADRIEKNQTIPPPIGSA